MVVQEARKLSPGSNTTMNTTMLTLARLGGWGKYNNQMYERRQQDLETSNKHDNKKTQGGGKYNNTTISISPPLLICLMA